MGAALKRILVVEDEPDQRLLCETVLTRIGGFEVLSAGGGAEAAAIAGAFGPDLMLLDVKMPGLDGPATLSLLRGAPGLAEVPAVFMTAKAMPAELAALRDLGAAEVLVKPFEMGELCARLHMIHAAARGASAPSADAAPPSVRAGKL